MNLLLRLLILAALLGSALCAGAAEPAPDTLVLMNRAIIQFRAPLLGAPPEQRVERARVAINEGITRSPGAAINVQEDPLGRLVMLGDRLAFVITAEDVDKLSGERIEALTAHTVAALQQALAEMHETRDVDALLRGLLWLAIETAVAVLLLWLLVRSRRWLRVRLIRAAARRAEKLRAFAGGILHPARVFATLNRLLALPYWALVALLAYTWLSTALGRFPWTRAWGEQLNGFLLDNAASLLWGMLRTLPNLFVAGTMGLIAYWLLRLIRPFFDRVEAGERNYGWLDAETVRPTRRLLNAAVWIFALVMAYPYLPGSGSEAFKGMSVLLGLMISLGSTSVVGQAASGLILMYTRTLRRGEYIRIGEHEGTIVELGLLNTRLRTGRGAEITLPNSLIVSSSTTNYSRTVQGNGYVIDTAVTIGYDTPWRQVEAMLIEAARRTSGILAEPRPAVFQTALSDFYPEYTLVCQAIPAAPRPRAEVLSELHANIQDVFNEYGVQIMSPHYLGDPAAEKRVPKERWYEAPAAPPRS